MSTADDLRHQDKATEATLLKAVPLPDGPLTEQLRQRVRDEVQAYMKEHRLRIAIVARSIGDGEASKWSQVIKGTYNKVSTEKLDELIRELNDWMEQDARRRATAPTRQFKLITPARVLLDAAQTAQRLNRIVLAYGPSGFSKTTTAHAIVERHVGALLIRLDAECRTARQICNRLFRMLRLSTRRRKGGPVGTRIERIVERVRGSNRLLIIDEAHRVTDDGLELLRDIYDQTSIPILLLCTIDLRTRIEGEGDEYHGQFFSRVHLFVDIVAECSDGGQRLPITGDDIRALFVGPKVRLSRDAVGLLRDIANYLGRGSLRRCENLVTDAVVTLRKKAGANTPVVVTAVDLGGAATRAAMAAAG